MVIQVGNRQSNVYWIKPMFDVFWGEEVLRNGMDFDFQVKLIKDVIWFVS